MWLERPTTPHQPGFRPMQMTAGAGGGGFECCCSCILLETSGPTATRSVARIWNTASLGSRFYLKMFVEKVARGNQDGTAGGKLGPLDNQYWAAGWVFSESALEH